jgi:hypothetical protein
MGEQDEDEFYACHVCGRRVDFDAPETVNALSIGRVLARTPVRRAM